MEHSVKGFRLGSDPQGGAAITGLFHEGLGRNLLMGAQPQAHLTLEGGATFAVAGWVEAFPSLEPCASSPTMGWAWRLRPSWESADGRLVTHWAHDSWQLTRTLWGEGDTLHASYVVANVSDAPAPALWASHVLYPLAHLSWMELPCATAIAGPGCELEEVAEQLSRVQGSWRLTETSDVQRSWKFFVPASADIVLQYADARLTVGTDAPWWGVWLNRGMHGVCCIGIEPTTAPTDSLREVRDLVAPSRELHYAWQLTVAPGA